MNKLTETRNEKAVIPLRNSVMGLDLPRWVIEKPSQLEQFLSGDAADRLAAYEATGLAPEDIKRLKEAI